MRIIRRLLLGILIVFVIIAVLFVLVAVKRRQEYGRGLDLSQAATVQRDIAYCNTNDPQQKLDLYTPFNAPSTGGLVVYIHGGGWNSGDKAKGFEARMLPSLQRQGMRVVAINYRLAPAYTFPAQIEDVKCAVRFLRAHAAKYGVDASRIRLLGESAGAHLAALAATSTDSDFRTEPWGGHSSRVERVAALYGAYELVAPGKRAQNSAVRQAFRSQADVQAGSPIQYVSGDDPPFLLIHGEKDSYVSVDQSQKMYEKLLSQKVPVTFIRVKNAEHGFFSAGGAVDPSVPEIVETVTNFLARP